MYKGRRFRFGYSTPFDAPREGGTIYKDNQYSYASKFTYEVAQRTATTPAQPAPVEQSDTPTYSMGQEIEANYFDSGYYERGTIVDRYGDDGYIIQYTDGDRQAMTALGIARDVRPVASETSTDNPYAGINMDAINSLVAEDEPPTITEHTLVDGTIIREFGYEDKDNQYEVEHGGIVDTTNILTQQEIRRVFNGENINDVVGTPEYDTYRLPDGTPQRRIVNADGTRMEDDYFNRGARDMRASQARESQRARDEAFPFGQATNPDDFAEPADKRELLDDDAPETREEAISRLQNQSQTQDELGIGEGSGTTETNSSGATFATTGGNK